jgi:hypothetical protein
MTTPTVEAGPWLPDARPWIEFKGDAMPGHLSPRDKVVALAGTERRDRDYAECPLPACAIPWECVVAYLPVGISEVEVGR